MENLNEWAKIYIKSRDAMTQSITGFDDRGPDFLVKKTTGDILFLIRPNLIDPKDLLEKAQGQTSVVVLNTRKNLNFLLQYWDQLAMLEKLCVFFVNPASNEKWLIYPHTHNQITEKAALRRGLEAMFSEVAQVQ